MKEQSNQFPRTPKPSIRYFTVVKQGAVIYEANSAALCQVFIRAHGGTLRGMR